MSDTQVRNWYGGISVDFVEGLRGKRMSGAERRERLLDTAQTEFACKGLQGTTTAVLAKRSGITEPVLYTHFENKDQLFREAVERGMENRLQMLEAKFSQFRHSNLVDCVQSMAEATVAVCIFGSTNAMLTAWALLEATNHAVDLHRREVGSVCLLWERKLEQCTLDRRSGALVSMRVVPFSVQACIAYGFWLAVLRHNDATADAIGREFAKGVAMAAVAQMNDGLL